MGLGIIILSEINQKEISYDTTYMQTLKQDTNELTYETDAQTQRIDLYLPEWREEKGRLEGWGQQMQLLYREWINKKSYCIAQGPTFTILRFKKIVEKNMKKNVNMYN